MATFMSEGVEFGTFSDYGWAADEGQISQFADQVTRDFDQWKAEEKAEQERQARIKEEEARAEKERQAQLQKRREERFKKIKARQPRDVKTQCFLR